MSSNNTDEEECVMHSKSGNIGTMINDKANEIIKKLFVSVLWLRRINERYTNLC